MTRLWDVRSAMEEKESRMIEGIVAKNRKRESYYIFIHANWTSHDMNELKTTYMLRSTKPPEMLGTKLYYVDNTKGSITKEWELPMDVIVPGEYLDMANPSESVAISAKKVAPSIVMS